jgi:hypothetical protein
MDHRGLSCLQVGVVNPSTLKTERLPRQRHLSWGSTHPPSTTLRAALSRVSGLIPYPQADLLHRFAPTAAIQSRTALATNSEPLSERICPGIPRTMNKSDSTSITSMGFSLRATRIAGSRA